MWLANGTPTRHRRKDHRYKCASDSSARRVVVVNVGHTLCHPKASAALHFSWSRAFVIEIATSPSVAENSTAA